MTVAELLPFGAPPEIGMALDAGPYDAVEQMIKIAIAVIALILFGLAISAYRRLQFRRLLYAAAAFALFAGQMLFEFLEDSVPEFEAPYNGVIFLGITLAILILFFVALVGGRRKAPDPKAEDLRVQ